MDSWTRRRATWGVACALVAVVVLGALVGTREVTADLEPRVREAVRSVAGADVGVDVQGREVRIDPEGTDPALVDQVAARVRELRGVRSVTVESSRVAEAAEAPGDARDIDLGLRVQDRAALFSTAVPTRELARAIEARVTQVRGVPVAVGLSVDPTLPTPRWWPGLARVLDATAPVADLSLDVEAGRLEISGRTASRAGAERVRTAVEDVGLVDDVDVDLLVGLEGISDADAATIELADVTFALGSATLDPDARSALDAVARAVVGSHVVLDVLGHAGPGDPGKGDELARARARAARDYLLQRGVPADRVVVTAVGSDADQGVDVRDERYRRVDFRVEERD